LEKQITMKELTAVEWLLEQLDVDTVLTRRQLSDVINQAKKMESEQLIITENTSDGYHTFKELYDFRKAYNAALFNEWAQHKHLAKHFEHTQSGIKEVVTEIKYKFDVHKSWKHHDGELCFGGGWFIDVALLPEGQISNHYKEEDWDLFQIPEVEKAKYPFDGHSSADVINRLLSINNDKSNA